MRYFQLFDCVKFKVESIFRGEEACLKVLSLKTLQYLIYDLPALGRSVGLAFIWHEKSVA